MSKQLDWGAIATVNFDDKRRKSHGMKTGKQMFAEAHANLRKAEEALSRRKELEPVLRQALLKAMVTHTPIEVRNPIQNPTEALNGIAKSDDDDGFYSSGPSASAEAKASAKFEEVMEIIPAGINLIYKAWDKQLGQWLFKGSNGHEYAIYDKSSIIFKGSQIENPGLYGLLFATNLIDV